MAQNEKEIPPLVRFEVQAEEDRAASVEAGRPVFKDVIYAHITPSGSRDTVMREVQAWFENLRQQVKEERFPKEWLRRLEEGLEEFKKDNLADVTIGTSLKNWAGISPAEAKNCINAKVMTIEQLAGANEEALAAIGIGGRELKDRAAAYMRSVGGDTSLALENSSLKEQVKSLQQTVDSMQTQLQKANAQIERLTAKAQ